MIRLITIAVLLPLAGCAGKDASTYDESATYTVGTYEAIDSAATSDRAEHGVITVADVSPRSDIAVIPPSVQHVVWRRTDSVAHASAVEPGVPEMSAPNAPANAPKKRKRMVREHWPLLEEDMNYESLIGELGMCDPKDYGNLLEPCESPEKYECFTPKQGPYCLERE